MKKLSFSKSASDWNEGIPIGNGFLGAMVFGDVNKERIQVNEDSLWSGGFINRTNIDSLDNLNKIRELLFDGNIKEAQLLASRAMYSKHPHMRHYQTLGDVWIEFFDVNVKEKLYVDESGVTRIEKNSPKISSYKRELDLCTAIGSTEYTINNNNYSREFFASYPEKVIVYKIKSEECGQLSFDLSLSRKDLRSGRGSSFCDGIEAYSNKHSILYGHQGSADDGIDFAMGVKVEAVGGSQYKMGSHIIVENANEAIIYITGRTSYRSEQPRKWCIDTLDIASSKKYRTLVETHVNDYKEYFDTMSINFEKSNEYEKLSTDERLKKIKNGVLDLGLIETYFDFGRYLLISSSREGSLPSNLQGIWNQEFEPAWGSKYTININTQMNYWLAEKTGLSTLHMPLIEHLKIVSEKGKDVAKTMYGARGFCCHHNMDLWGDCAPQDNHMPATIWPMGGAWLCLHLWEHYQYTRDKEFLKEYFNILRDAVLFFIDYMVKDKNGNWVTGPSVSPENIYLNDNGEFGSLCMGPSMDSQILRELFNAYLEASEILNIKDDINNEVKTRLDGLPETKIGRYGQIQEWSEDYEELEIGHRHISHLFALYPANQINKDKTPELAKAAMNTLKRRLDNGGGHTGWSKAWIINFWARLQQGEEAFKNIKELLMNSTLDNLLDNHPPFQIDGNFGGATGILEMLIQDFEEEILVLPALPTELTGGSVKGVRTKSGAIIDITWSNCKLEEIRITAKRDNTITLKIDKNVLKDSEDLSVEYQLEKNKNYILKY